MDIREVVAALIWESGKFMICQRPATKKRALLWEFVGGKVEPGETRQEALIRECQEELAITVSVGSLFTEVVHEYPDITIRLCLYRCTIAEGMPQLLEHVDLKWITPEEIPQYDFCPADETILKMILLEGSMRKELEAQADPGYREFQAKLLPTVSPDWILGVRTPVLRAIARQMKKLPDAKYYLDIRTHNSFDETQLHSFLLDEEKDYQTALAQVEAFLPAVDNWATCDQLAPKAFCSKPQLRQECYRWMQSELPYTVRFGVEMLMSHFLDAAFDPADLEKVAAVRSEEYYVNMMVAWYFATAMAKQESSTLLYLEQKRLPEWVHRKAIQKCIESNRISAEMKTYLRSLK